MYEAALARFLSQDPAESDPNLYLYASNNPVNRVDPSGLQDSVLAILQQGVANLRRIKPAVFDEFVTQGIGAAQVYRGGGRVYIRDSKKWYVFKLNSQGQAPSSVSYGIVGVYPGTQSLNSIRQFAELKVESSNANSALFALRLIPFSGLAEAIGDKPDSVEEWGWVVLTTVGDATFTAGLIFRGAKYANLMRCLSLADNAIGAAFDVTMLLTHENKSEYAGDLLLRLILATLTPQQRKTFAEAVDSSPIEPRYRTFYHKGDLGGGLADGRRPLSTGDDRELVERLQRSGEVHAFKVPEDVFLRWQADGLVDKLNNVDAATGIRLDEWRFIPGLADEINKYKVSQ